ncbi:MAG TPA: M20/M25/M40 family metallo-hydrolase [Terriglobales bacterium]|nr:M20/M25/M40 family metallo-hydrolase [Terriglobales bacterium]
MRTLAFALLLGCCLLSFAQTDNALAERIVGAAMVRGGASDFLESLADGVGGRVTGSAESKAAAELILRTLQQAGFSDAHFEEYSLESGWARGPLDVRVVSPVKRRLFAGSYAWVPGTNGPIEAPLVEGTLATDGKVAGDVSRFRGAAVIMDLRLPGSTSFSLNYLVNRTSVARQLAEAGAAAMIIISDKPHRLLNTSAFGFYPHGTIPVLSVSIEDGSLLHRLLAKGPVKLSLGVQNTFSKGPLTELNVVAEIPGANPDEVVLVGGHFDSWDPADGANDNGSGVAAIVEAARILKQLGVRPRRTIRFVFFSGEEQACLGSRAYVAAHHSELDRLRMVLIMDGGAQAPLGFMVNHRADLEGPVQKIIAPLAALGAGKVYPQGDPDTDHVPFQAEGVPALVLAVEDGEYAIHHHAETDTLDKIDPKMLSLDTAVMALAAYTFASAKEVPGRRLSAEEVHQSLKDTGLADGFAILYGPGKP